MHITPFTELYEPEVYVDFGIPVEYPESDGRPVAESDFQLRWIVYLLSALRQFFQHQDKTYVSGDLLIYFEKGNPHARVAPDIFIVHGVGNHFRPSYKMWEECNTPPSFVLELLSPSTAWRDRTEKKALYEHLGVTEYILFDPVGTLVDPILHGFRLIDGHYEPIADVSSDPDTQIIPCETIGLELHVADDMLKLFDPASQSYLLGYKESEQKRLESEQKRIESEQKRLAAEARIAKLEARLRELGEDI